MHLGNATAHWFSGQSQPHRLVIYDGLCIFCNAATRFIARRDPQRRYHFTPLQSDLAQALIRHHQIPNVGVDTFLLIKDGRCHIWTDAAFEIASELSGPWRLSAWLRIIPRALRDTAYRLFARNRYRLFGRRTHCEIPNKDELSRYVDLPIPLAIRKSGATTPPKPAAPLLPAAMKPK